MISVFLLLFFGGMILLALPVVGCIVLSARTYRCKWKEWA